MPSEIFGSLYLLLAITLSDLYSQQSAKGTCSISRQGISLKMVEELHNLLKLVSLLISLIAELLSSALTALSEMILSELKSLFVMRTLLITLLTVDIYY